MRKKWWQKVKKKKYLFVGFVSQNILCVHLPLFSSSLLPSGHVWWTSCSVLTISVPESPNWLFSRRRLLGRWPSLHCADAVLRSCPSFGRSDDVFCSTLGLIWRGGDLCATKEGEGGWTLAPGSHTRPSGSLFVVQGCTVPAEGGTASSLCDTPPDPLPVPCSRALLQARVPVCGYSLHHLAPDPGSVCATEMVPWLDCW